MMMMIDVSFIEINSHTLKRIENNDEAAKREIVDRQHIKILSI